MSDKVESVDPIFRDDFECNPVYPTCNTGNINFSADVITAGKNDPIVPIYELKLTVEPRDNPRCESPLVPNGIIMRPPFATKGGIFSFTIIPSANTPLDVALEFNRVDEEPTAWEYLKYRFRKWLSSRSGER